jgi:hypothetical protein
VRKRFDNNDFDDSDDAMFDMLSSRYAQVVKSGGKESGKHRARFDDEMAGERRSLPKHKRVRPETH